MKTKIILVIAASVALVSSCKFFGVGEGAKNGSIWGDQIEASEVLETRSIVVPDFNGLDVGMACKVEYVPGDCRLEVETHENLFDHLKFEVDSAGVLRISQDNYNVRNMNTMNIYVQSPSLVKTNLSGAARFSAAGGIEAETFDLSISGAGDVSIDGLDAASVEMTLSGACKLNLQGLDSQEFSISIAGAGDGEISGRTDNADVSISGAGKLDLRELEVNELTTSVSGAGNILKPKN